MPILDLPSEILDAIIDELQDDQKSLLQASLACRAFYPRTRVYLFHVVRLYSKSCCDRLRALFTLSPNLAPHFKSLQIDYMRPTPEHCGALTVIESLIDISHLSLGMGDWRALPDFAVSSLQSHSYHSLVICADFKFRTIGEICSLVKNSPNLRIVDISTPPHCGITEECNLDHSLHSAPAPVAVRITEFLTDSAGIIQKSVLSSRPCPFSGNNIHTLAITLPDVDATVHRLPQGLNQYLARSHSSLKRLRVTHPLSRFRTASSETLHISGIEQIAVALDFIDRASHVLEWWISNLAAVNEHCAIRSFTFTLASSQRPGERHPALAWKDLWTRLAGCLTSSKMALLERVGITFRPRPAEWDALKTSMEGNFVGLKQLSCEVTLDAVGRAFDY